MQMQVLKKDQRGALQAPPGLDRLIDDFLCRRSERTRLAYRADLEAFGAFLQAAGAPEALAQLISAGPGRANALILSYKSDMVSRGLSPATVNRRLATLRSAVKLARRLGLVTWSIEIENERIESYRDTTGPGKQGFAALLLQAGRSQNVFRVARDTAILRLLHDLALRRGEIVSLDLEDLSEEDRTLGVLGKGKTQKQLLRLPEATYEALKRWVDVRGRWDGPIFINCDRAGKGAARSRRLTGTAIYYLVRDLGNKAGLVTRPHALRHTAITEALDLTNGDVRAVQRFSRHRNIQTVTIYDDNRRDLGGRVAEMVAASA